MAAKLLGKHNCVFIYFDSRLFCILYLFIILFFKQKEIKIKKLYYFNKNKIIFIFKVNDP